MKTRFSPGGLCTGSVDVLRLVSTVCSNVGLLMLPKANLLLVELAYFDLSLPHTGLAIRVKCLTQQPVTSHMTPVTWCHMVSRGVLLYSTCSQLPDINPMILCDF